MHHTLEFRDSVKAVEGRRAQSKPEKSENNLQKRSSRSNPAKEREKQRRTDKNRVKLAEGLTHSF